VRGLVLLVVLAAGLPALFAGAQNDAQKLRTVKSEPKYSDTFSGPIVELSSDKLTVSRSILGKPAEKRTFWIKSDTRVEGKLRMKAKVTVGFVTTDDGDVARLIVVRTAQRPKKK
jgi:hypothetical protein